ncbi:MAG: RluA family pseudouridine synthase [Phycisphaeraceae bacterium]|nr:MAG: RluA family pseudouridine synthase [Phycisphaeraceae bacterium]
MHPSVEPNPAVRFTVRFEDEHLAVVDKPPGVVTQPGKGHDHDALLNGLFARWGARLQNLGADRDFGLLHRLDKDTSGLVAVGLSPAGYDGLRAQFENRAIKKFYWCVVADPPSTTEGVIKRPLIEYTARDPHDPRKSLKLARVSGAGKPAVTAFRVLQTSPLGTLLECRPLTGRLHQVRVHLASIGSPILGDAFYATPRIKGLRTRLALHAHRLIAEHPVTAQRLDVRSPFPNDLRALLNRLKLRPPNVPSDATPAPPEPPHDDPPEPG